MEQIPNSSDRNESVEEQKKYRLQLPDGSTVEASSLEEVMEMAREARENN